jgi:hypothetical protein
MLESLTIECGPLAQLAEQGTLNAKVRGSSPWRVIAKRQAKGIIRETFRFLFGSSKVADRFG